MIESLSSHFARQFELPTMVYFFTSNVLRFRPSSLALSMITEMVLVFDMKVQYLPETINHRLLLKI